MRQETSDTPSGSRHRHRVMSWCSSYHCVRCDVCCGRLWPSTFTQVQLWGSCTLSFFILCHFILQILWGCFFTSLHFVRHTSTVYTIYADTNCVDKTTLKDPFMGKGDLWVSLPTRKKNKKNKRCCVIVGRIPAPLMSCPWARYLNPRLLLLRKWHFCSM